MKIIEIINGCLLSDGSIRSDKGKYFTFQVVAKDKKFLRWIGKLLKRFSIRYWISQSNPGLFLIGFYINSCPYPEFVSLRQKWYRKINGKNKKVVPRDLKLTPTTLLFWYLGDGSLIRRKNDSNRVPFLVLATNSFFKEDINFLVQKLKELNFSFYPVKYKSGFTGKECGYCLYSNTQDGTPFRFFELIGFQPPEEIANCSTGRKGRSSKEHFIKDKWPTEEDWIKILSNVKEVGRILRKRRLQLGLSQNQLADKIGIRRENIRDVELGKKNFSVRNFKKILKALNLDITYLLNKLKGG